MYRTLTMRYAIRNLKKFADKFQVPFLKYFIKYSFVWQKVHLNAIYKDLITICKDIFFITYEQGWKRYSKKVTHYRYRYFL